MPKAAGLLGVVLVAVLIAFVGTGTASAGSFHLTVDCANDDLQASIDGAPTGATIHVRDTCVRNFTIARDIQIHGFGSATLQGDGGTVVTIAEGAAVVLTDIVVTGGSVDALAPVPTRVAGIYNSGSLVLDGRTAVHDNETYHCGPDNSPSGPCDPRYPGVVELTGGIINRGELVMAGRASVRDHAGRGVWNLGTMTMRGWSSVENNSTLHSGGGVLNDGTLTMDDHASISRNRATYRASVGGGVHNTGTLTMNDRSSIHHNESENPGAGISSWGTVRLYDRAAVSENREVGIYAWAGVIVLDGRYSITGNTFYGVYLRPEATVIGSLRGVTGNTPDDCYSVATAGACIP